MLSDPQTLSDRHFDELLQQGIIAAKGGQRQQARRFLEKATMLKANDARPWIWLSATTDDPQEQRMFLERAVAADPSNATARRGLVMLSEKLDKSRLMPEGQGIAPRQPAQPEEAQSQAYLCPKCGGRMLFDIQRQDLTCPYCGYVQEIEKRLAADNEQAVDFVMPTTRAHRWAEAQQRLRCERCGALTLLPAGQRSDCCSYCGSNRLVASAEMAELVDPQVVALMKIDERKAQESVKQWLGKGLLAPDDLALKAGGLQLRCAYYPFWTFDGTLEVPWSCEVNEGTSRNPRWVTRNGTEFEFFDDVLVSGVKVMQTSEIASIEPFNLKDLLEFSPEYLAGWPTLSYDYPLSDASLKAREQVIKRLRQNLYMRVEPGRQKRNLNSGAGKWSGLTFKHVLLPLWVGVYQFQGKEYRLLINGQTGKVGGTKPRDMVKVALVVILSVVITAILTYLLATFLY